MNDRLTRFLIVCMFIALFDDAEEAGPLLSFSGNRDRKLLVVIVSYVGDEVTLHCDLTNVTGVIQWLRNDRRLHVGGELDGSDRFHLGINQSEGGVGIGAGGGTGAGASHHFLRIQGVRGEDDGVWHCQDVHDEQPVWILTSEPIRIVVLIPPTQPYISVEDRRLPVDTTFTTKEKNVISFDCVTDKVNPAPDRVEWFLGDENLTSTSRLHSDFDVVERIYRIRSVVSLEANRKDHRKTLACLVYHRAINSAAIARVVLNILYSPSFVISRIPDFGYPIYEGTDVSLKCEINANPPSTSHWIRDNGPPSERLHHHHHHRHDHQSDDGYLNFTAIGRDDAGWYRCSTRHEFGVFASFGYLLNVRPDEPDVVDNPSPQVLPQVTLGRTVLLECADSGDKPPTSYCWARVTNGDRLESLVVEQNFPADKVLHADADVYKCIARSAIDSRNVDRGIANSLPVDITSKRLNTDMAMVMTGKPTVEPVNHTLMAVVGHSASFSVRFCARPEPMRMQWIAANVVVNPGDSIGRFVASDITPISGDANSPNCYESTFGITDVRREDAGQFLFIVTNSMGIDGAEVLLNITQASFSVSSGNIKWVDVKCVTAVLLVHIFALFLHRVLDNS